MRHLHSLRLCSALGASLLLATGCSDTDDQGGGGTAPGNPELAAFQKAATGAAEGLAATSATILGESGLVAQAAALREIDPTTAAGAQQWAVANAQLQETFEQLVQQGARAALAAEEMTRERAAFLALQSRDFAPESASSQALTTRPKVFMIPVLVAATAGITVYRWFRGVADAVDATQAVVGETAGSGPAGNAAVTKALRDHGVTVPDGASGEELSSLFANQSREVRRQVTNDVRDWNADAVMGGGTEGDSAATRAVADRDRTATAAVNLGRQAVNGVVAGTQAVTGGVGDLVGGVRGAATELALTATELDPMSVLERHVTAVAASKTQEPEPRPEPKLPESEARANLQDAAKGGWLAGAKTLFESANSLIASLQDLLSSQGIPATSVPSTLVVSTGSLDEAESAPGSNGYAGSLPLPGFEAGDQVELLVTRPATVPQEVSSFTVGSPLTIEHIPVSGTMSIDSAPAGSAIDGFQRFAVTVTSSNVPTPTRIICHATNGSCSPSSVSLSAAGSVSFDFDAVGSATATFVRADSGESHLISLVAEKPDPAAACNDAKNHLCTKLPTVGCDIDVMDTARNRVISACGETDAQQFFATAESTCC